MTALVPTSVTPPPEVGTSARLGVSPVVQWPVSGRHPLARDGVPLRSALVPAVVVMLGVALMAASALLVPLAPVVGGVALASVASLAGVWGAYHRSRRIWG